MLGTYYYHEIIRRTIIAFGTLFNNIEIKHKTQAGGAFSSVKVPIVLWAYWKILSKIRAKTRSKKNEFPITLPRLAFEMDSISYDKSKKGFNNADL